MDYKAMLYKMKKLGIETKAGCMPPTAEKDEDIQRALTGDAAAFPNTPQLPKVASAGAA